MTLWWPRKDEMDDDEDLFGLLDDMEYATSNYGEGSRDFGWGVVERARYHASAYPVQAQYSTAYDDFSPRNVPHQGSFTPGSNARDHERAGGLFVSSPHAARRGKCALHEDQWWNSCLICQRHHYL